MMQLKITKNEFISCAALRAKGFSIINRTTCQVRNDRPFSYNGKPAVLLPQNVYAVNLRMQNPGFTKLPNLFSF